MAGISRAKTSTTCAPGTIVSFLAKTIGAAMYFTAFAVFCLVMAYFAARDEVWAREERRHRHTRIGDPWCSCPKCYVRNPDGTVVHRSALDEDDPRRRPSATTD